MNDAWNPTYRIAFADTPLGNPTADVESTKKLVPHEEMTKAEPSGTGSATEAHVV